MKFVLLVSLFFSLNVFAETQKCANDVNTGVTLYNDGQISYSEGKDIENSTSEETTTLELCVIAKEAFTKYLISTTRFNAALESTLQGIHSCAEKSSKDAIVSNLRNISSMIASNEKAKGSLLVMFELYECNVQF